MSILKCAKCGSNYTHHDLVTVYIQEEGDPIHRRIEIHKERTLIDKDMSDNPSHQRSGITIRYNCEMCGTYSYIEIHQEKGQTILDRTNSVGINVKFNDFDEE